MHFEKPMVRLCCHTGRIFLRHGPIDLFVQIDAQAKDTPLRAVEPLTEEFKTILPSLCDELPVLRTDVERIGHAPRSAVGRKMFNSASMVSDYDVVTPMISVAGSVADHICAFIDSAFKTRRILVNNGGDIAFKLASGETLKVGVCDDIAAPNIATTLVLASGCGAQGIATSGWKGRSFSFGIADAVTVLARSAASADAAATLIANAVDLPRSKKVRREPANTLAPDSDLGGRRVTVDVGMLTASEIDLALSRGQDRAVKMHKAGLIHSAYLALQGRNLVIGAPPNVQRLSPRDRIRTHSTKMGRLEHA